MELEPARRLVLSFGLKTGTKNRKCAAFVYFPDLARNISHGNVVLLLLRKACGNRLAQTSLLFHPQCWGIVYFTARTARCLRRGSLTPDDDDDDSLAPVCPCCNSRLIAPTKEIDQNVIVFLSFLRKRRLSYAVSGKRADCSPQLRTCIKVFVCLFVCFYSVRILTAGVLLSEVSQVQGTED